MGVLDTFSLAGKVALVTGGAGKYGRQILAAVAEAGAKTYVASRGLEALEEVAREHRDAGQDVTALQYDQGDEASILALRDKIIGDAGRCDILVNNSVARPMTKGYDDDASTFAESMHVNATGLFIITRAFGDEMAKHKTGSIINIGSIMALIAPDPVNYRNTDMSGFYPDYFFHKAGMVNFTRFMASYYGPHTVRCNCIHPGGYQVPSQPEVFVRQYSDRTVLDRMANDTDLMGIIVFLASDASLYVTATNIPVDGGYVAK